MTDSPQPHATHTAMIPEPYIMRPVTFDDIPAAVALFVDYQLRFYGKAIANETNLHREWETPEFDLQESTMGIFDPDGNMLAYAEVWSPKDLPVRPFADYFTHSSVDALTFGLPVLEWAKTHSQQFIKRVPEHAKVTLVSDALSTDTDAHRLLQEAGFTAMNRALHKMTIHLSDEVQIAVWADGMTLRTAEGMEDNLRPVYDAHQDSFRDHRNFVERDPEEGYRRWLYWNVEDKEKFDPSLWFLAMVGDEIAGISMCVPHTEEDPNEGYVAILGVRRPYRGRGIAKALLLHSFHEFKKRGKTSVSLYVDGSSLTGANHLYSKAGMHVARAYETYELVLRDGVEISKQDDD